MVQIVRPVHTAFRADAALLARIDAVARVLSEKDGARHTRSDAIRIALERGVAELERELAR